MTNNAIVDFVDLSSGQPVQQSIPVTEGYQKSLRSRDEYKDVPIFQVREYPDDFLSLRCPPWIGEVSDGYLQNLLRGMEATMVAHGALGISGPQVGIQHRVLCVDVNGSVLTMINPVVVSVSVEVRRGREGCLSFPLLFVDVERADGVTVKFTDRDGNEVQSRFYGMTARAIQHEVDHLDGVVFIDRIPKFKRRGVLNKMYLNQRKWTAVQKKMANVERQTAKLKGRDKK